MRRIACQVIGVVQLCALVAPSQAQAPPAGADIGGEWRQTDFNGVAQVDNGRCLGVYLTERVYTFNPQLQGATGRSGIEATLRHGRLVRKLAAGCKLPETTAQAPFVYENMRTWQFVSRPSGDGSGLSVEAIFDESRGNPCADCVNEGFKTTISVENGALRDTFGTVETGDDLVFHRESGRSERIASGQRALKSFVTLLDAGDCSNAYTHLFSRWRSSETLSQWSAGCGSIVSGLGKVKSRSIIEKYYVSRAWNGSAFENGEFVYLTNRVLSDKNLSAMEFALVGQEDGQWRVAMYQISW